MLDIASFFCVIVNLYILLFVSKTTQNYLTVDENHLKVVLKIVLIEHAVFAFKSILETIIPDNEAWVEREEGFAEDILKRVKEGIQNTTLSHYVKSYLPETLVSEILSHFKFDVHKEKKLMQKIAKGCEKYHDEDTPEEVDDEEEEDL